MDDVKRFGPHEDHEGWTHGMDERPSGNYVRFDDYKALALKLEEAELDAKLVGEWAASADAKLKAAESRLDHVRKRCAEIAEGTTIAVKAGEPLTDFVKGRDDLACEIGEWLDNTGVVERQT